MFSTGLLASIKRGHPERGRVHSYTIWHSESSIAEGGAADCVSIHGLNGASIRFKIERRSYTWCELLYLLGLLRFVDITCLLCTQGTGTQLTPQIKCHRAFALYTLLAYRTPSCAKHKRSSGAFGAVWSPARIRERMEIRDINTKKRTAGDRVRGFTCACPVSEVSATPVPNFSTETCVGPDLEKCLKSLNSNLRFLKYIRRRTYA